MEKIKKIISGIILLFLMMPIMASAAQGGLTKPPAPAGIGGTLGNPDTSFTDIAVFIINIALAVVGIISVAFLIYGGFRYITSAGSSEATEEAKKVIQNAIIGLVVVILAYVIVVVIINAIAKNNF